MLNKSCKQGVSNAITNCKSSCPKCPAWEKDLLEMHCSQNCNWTYWNLNLKNVKSSISFSGKLSKCPKWAPQSTMDTLTLKCLISSLLPSLPFENWRLQCPWLIEVLQREFRNICETIKLIYSIEYHLKY